MAKALAAHEISFDTSWFQAGNVRFDYVVVESLSFYRHIRTSVASNSPYAAAAALTRNSWFEVYFKNSTACVAVVEAGFGPGKPLAIEAFLSCYGEIARRTFSTRCARYTDQLAKSGRFQYDGKFVAEDGKVFSATGRELLDFGTADLIWKPFEVRPRRGPKVAGVVDGARRLLKMYNNSYTVDHEISLLYDRDVFLFLLKRLWGVELPG